MNDLPAKSPSPSGPLAERYEHPGTVTTFNRPEGEGIRVDSHVESGYAIPPFYDSMIAKLIVHAADRDAAIARSEEALSNFQIEGVKTTIPIHQRIMNEPDFISGDYNTGLIGRMLGS